MLMKSIDVGAHISRHAFAKNAAQKSNMSQEGGSSSGGGPASAAAGYMSFS